MQTISLMDAMGQGVFALLVALVLVAVGWGFGLLLLIKGKRATAVRFPLLWSLLPAGCAVAAAVLATRQFAALRSELALEGNPLPPDVVAQLQGLPTIFAAVGLGAASSLLFLALLAMLTKRDRESPEPEAA